MKVHRASVTLIIQFQLTALILEVFHRIHVSWHEVRLSNMPNNFTLGAFFKTVDQLETEEAKANLAFEVAADANVRDVIYYKHLSVCTYDGTTSRGGELERRWGPVADTQMDKTTQKKTDSTAFLITVSDLIWTREAVWCSHIKPRSPSLPHICSHLCNSKIGVNEVNQPSLLRLSVCWVSHKYKSSSLKLPSTLLASLLKSLIQSTYFQAGKCSPF